MPLPPARVPFALPRDRDADHRFGEQQEAGDDSRRKQRGAVSEEAPVPNGAHRKDDRPEDRHARRARCPVAASLFGPLSGGRFASVQRNHVAMTINTAPRSFPRWRINRGPRSGRASTNAEPAAKNALTSSPTGIAIWKPARLSEKRTPAVPKAWRPMKPPVAMNASDRSKYAGVPPPVGCLACRIAESERHTADEAEDDEMRLMVMELGVELRPKQQRDEPDQRQRDREEAGDHNRPRPRSEPREAQPPGGGASPGSVRTRFAVPTSTFLEVGRGSHVCGSAARTILRRSRGRFLVS